MTVKELVRCLKQYPQNSEVELLYSTFTGIGELVIRKDLESFYKEHILLLEPSKVTNS